MKKKETYINSEKITCAVEKELLKAKKRNNLSLVYLYTNFLDYSNCYEMIPFNLLETVIKIIYPHESKEIIENWREFVDLKCIKKINLKDFKFVLFRNVLNDPFKFEKYVNLLMCFDIGEFDLLELEECCYVLNIDYSYLLKEMSYNILRNGRIGENIYDELD